MSAVMILLKILQHGIVKTIAHKLSGIMTDFGGGQPQPQFLEIERSLEGFAVERGAGFEVELRSRFCHATADQHFRLKPFDLSQNHLLGDRGIHRKLAEKVEAVQLGQVQFSLEERLQEIVRGI